MSFVSCQLLVGAKHLEDKLSVIAKNSSANASPVQLSDNISLLCYSAAIVRIISPRVRIPITLPALSRTGRR
ncbi:hypothetical protein FJR06_12775 [Dolichospermum sp. UHCC 0352]|nr:hypothetical protein [Dolichospermum sp. UHCC 0352]